MTWGSYGVSCSPSTNRAWEARLNPKDCCTDVRRLPGPNPFMLRGIDPLLGPELLCILRSMGHGDEIAIVDANFPAAATAHRLVRLDGVPAVPIVRAIVAILPLDHFELDAAFRMATTGAPEHTPAIVAEFAAILHDAGYRRRIAALERTDFYSRARGAFAVVASGETRLWGNLILKKGAIAPT